MLVLSALLLNGVGLAQTADPGAEQLQKQAQTALQNGHIDVALSKLRPLSRQYPKNLRIQFDLGLALVRGGHLEEAMAPLQKSTGDPALQSEAHFLLAADSFGRGDFAQAVAECRKVDAAAHAERVLYMAEESDRRLGHLEEAKSAFHELITRYPDSGWTHYLMGNAYEDQQQFAKAIDEYRRAGDVDSTIPNVNFSVGYLYWRQQEFEDARPWLEKEVAAGCHSLANFYLGEIARGDKQLKKAEGYYRAALQCDEANAQAHLRLGIVLADESHFQDAIEHLKAAIKLQPQESSAHYHLASIYSHLGRAAESKAEYRKVREIQATKDKGADVTRDN